MSRAMCEKEKGKKICVQTGIAFQCVCVRVSVKALAALSVGLCICA